MRREKLLQIRLNETELITLRERMDNLGFGNASEFGRTAMLNPGRLNFRKLQALLFEVNKIGVNLNQLVRSVHRRETTEAQVLAEIVLIRKALSSLVEERSQR